MEVEPEVVPSPFGKYVWSAVFVVAGVLALGGFAAGSYGLVAWLAAAVIACLGLCVMTPRWGLLATALVGLGSSAYLLARKMDPEGTAICNVSAVLNCDRVNSSAASELFGVPVALYGACFFVGVAGATLNRPSPQARVFQSVGIFGVGGSAFSTYLAFESVRMGVICPVCVTIYACCFLLAGAGVVAARTESPRFIGDLGQVIRSTAFATFAVTFTFTWLFGQVVVRPDDLALLHYAVPQGPVVLDGNEALFGSPDARFQVVVFADFGCPHCGRAFPRLRRAVEDTPDVAVHFRVYPLSGLCNPAVRRQDWPEVCRAATAASCAKRQGKFWEFAGYVFARQDALSYDTEALISEAATASELDEHGFRACLSDPASLLDVRNDALAGVNLGISGTPAFFVKGVYGEGYVQVCNGLDGVLAAIRAARDGLDLPPPPSEGVCDREDRHRH